MFFRSRYEAKVTEFARFSRIFDRYGFCLVRGFLTPDVASRISRRLETNLAALRPVFPDYDTNAWKMVYSLAVAFSEGDASLASRILAAGSRQWYAAISSDERERIWREVGHMLDSPLVSSLRHRSKPGRFKWHEVENFARWEKARPNTGELQGLYKH